MSYELTGIVKQIGEVVIHKNDFRKLQFVVTVDDGRFPQEIGLSLLGDNVERITSVSEGDRVTVIWNLRGNEYNNKHYVDLVAWKIDLMEAGKEPDKQEEFPPDDEIDEDLGF